MRSRREFLAAAAVWRNAQPSWRYEFPRDHFSHPDFRTEWWYYTGNLAAATGRRFGYELTFFRQGLDRTAPKSVWSLNDVWMAHLALTDVEGSRFFHTQRLQRSGDGLAGCSAETARVWNGNWSVQWKGESMELAAVHEDFSLRFTMTPRKAPVVHGEGGLSRKSERTQHASHYISLTRLASSGEIVLGGTRFAVSGLSWMDHEYFSGQLDGEQAGWDWLSLQFEDQTELMIYRIRHKSGRADSFSSGTFVAADGSARHLRAADFSLEPIAGSEWASPSGKCRYPLRWQLRVPSLGLAMQTRALLNDQELSSRSAVLPTYWEGAVEAEGSGRRARGYLELTGYGETLRFGAG
jgi:predicted secreted hydrolase